MDEAHWIALTVERIEAILFDSVARKRLSEESRAALTADRARLVAQHRELTS